MRSKTRSRGFTLVEILVVVAIIALLISMLMPTLGRARWQARVVVCKAHLHDLGASFVMYAHQHRDYFPVTAGSGYDSFYALWKGRLLKDVKILVDPATKNLVRKETLDWPVAYRTFTVDGVIERIPYMALNGQPSDIDDNAPAGRDDRSGGHSYEYNGCYDKDCSQRPSCWCPSVSSTRHKKASDMVSPAAIMLVHDNDDPVRGDTGCENSRSGNGNNCPQEWDNHGRHGMNMMFADGHADWIPKYRGKYTDFSSGYAIERVSVNASIDRIFARSQAPWMYQSRGR